MTRFRTIWLLTLAAVLFSASAPQAFAAWVCEGRTCGTTLLYCCCVAPEGARDLNCGRSTGPLSAGSAAGPASACATDCNCVLTVSAAEAARPAAPLGGTAPAEHLAALPQAPVYAGPVPTDRVVAALETRGPPLRSVHLATPSLRGPPLPGVPAFGS